MPKRLIEPDWKKLRLLPGYLQRAWFYIWDKADACGVYYHDQEYFKLDLRLERDVTLQALSELPECEILPGDRILIKNFLVVNYTKLKPDYNPHKPAFRAIERNGLCLNSSLNQAYLKLVEEDKEEDEGVTERGAGKTSHVDPKTLVPEMAQRFKDQNPNYAYDQKIDFPALLVIAGKISEWQKLTGDITEAQNATAIKKRWGEMVIKIQADDFYSTFSLSQIGKNFQSVVQKLYNGNQHGKTKQGGSHRAVITGEATGAGSFG